MSVDGVTITEDIELTDTTTSTEASIGDVELNAPSKSEFRNLIKNNLNENSIEIKSEDVLSNRSWWKPSDWVVWIKNRTNSNSNTVYNSVTTNFGVPKYDGEYLLLTRDAQLYDGDYDVIIRAINEGLFTTKSNSEGFSFYWTDKDEFTKKINTLNEFRAINKQTRDLMALLVPILERVGGIVVNKVKECVTMQAGGRFSLDETGYWFFKHGDETCLVLNDYAEEDKVHIDLHQGDCYFWFGTDVNLESIGLNNYSFNCCIDKDYNICFNTPFGEWTIATKSFIEGTVNKVINWGKCFFTKVASKIWNIFSTFIGRNTNIRNIKSTDTIKYPGLTLIQPIIGDTVEEQKRHATTMDPPFQF